MKNILLQARTAADIDRQVAKVLHNLGNPEPPLDLRMVGELLRLDRYYYSTTDDGMLREVLHHLKVGGKQMLLRPTILLDAVRTLSLKALYLPDQKRILLDSDLPKSKHRWNEAHEYSHKIIEWHAGMMLGDTEQTLTPACHEQIEGEANYAAGRLLFLGERFAVEASDAAPGLSNVLSLSKAYKNTATSTLWRYVEQAHPGIPMFGLVSGHPHHTRRLPAFDPLDPCRYFIRSPTFAQRFGTASELGLFDAVARYCGPQRGGPLGEDLVPLFDDNGGRHLFRLQTFFNRYEALTLGYYSSPAVIAG